MSYGSYPYGSWPYGGYPGVAGAAPEPPPTPTPTEVASYVPETYFTEAAHAESFESDYEAPFHHPVSPSVNPVYAYFSPGYAPLQPYADVNRFF